MAGVGGVTGWETRRILTEGLCPTSGLEIQSRSGSICRLKTDGDGFAAGSVLWLAQ